MRDIKDELKAAIDAFNFQPGSMVHDAYSEIISLRHRLTSPASLSPAATSGVDAGGAAVMQYRWRLKGRIEWHPGWYEGPPPPSDDDIEIETRTVYLAKPTSSPAGRVWTVKGWLPNGDGCEFTFGDESEYLRFMASKPATFDVSDIEELVVSSCGRALASLSTEVIALSPSTSAAEPVAHPDDLAVDRFAAAMKAKLAKKRAEGRGGWERKDECSNGFLSQLLREHIGKGDPVDVGNLAMMIHQRGERIG